MKKIKILYIIDVLNGMGGAERNLYNIIDSINKNKFEPKIICFQATNSFIDIFTDLGIEIIDINYNKTLSLPGILNLIKIYKYIKKNKFDIVQTYFESSDILGGTISYLAKVPIRISSRRDMGFKRTALQGIIYIFLNRLFTKIIAVSEKVKLQIIKKELTPSSKIEVIYSGIVPSKNYQHIDSKEMVIGLIANLRPIKGIHIAIKALSLIVPNKNRVILKIVGDLSDREYFNQLKLMCKNLAILNNVIFVGQSNNVFEELQTMDIYIQPSLSEGFSHTIIEAMSMGLPIIATDVGGNSEAIINEYNGYLIEKNNMQELAQKIEILIYDEEKRETFGNNSRKIFYQKFTNTIMISKLEKFYLTLFRKKNETD